MLQHQDISSGLQTWQVLHENYERDLRELVRRLSETHMMSAGDGPWMMFSARDGVELPQLGLKIHVSLAAHEFSKLWTFVLPAVLRRRLSFKLPQTLSTWYGVNAGSYGENQVGKIVTIYPWDQAQAFHVARELHELLPTSDGPMLRTDALLSPTGAVGLRYGVFTAPQAVLNESGSPEDFLELSDGSRYEDKRVVGALLPASINAPYPLYPWKDLRTFERLKGKEQDYV